MKKRCADCNNILYVDEEMYCDFYTMCVSDDCFKATDDRTVNISSREYEEFRGDYCMACDVFSLGSCREGDTKKCILELNRINKSKKSMENKIENAIKNENTEIKPSHYNAGKYDVIWFCEYHKLSFTVGNIIKYVFRAGKKDKDKEITDLKKAIEYIQRRIEFLEGEK